MQKSNRTLLHFLATAMLGALLFPLLPSTSFAATTVTNFSVRPTTIEPSVGSNYRLFVTVPNAIPEGDTLSLVFNAGFTMTGIDENDIDISDDSVQLETAATCGGTVDVTVVRTGQSIAFDICSGGGGAIAPGSAVEIDIGTIATSYGTGNSTITNPATSGRSYGIALTTVTNAMTASALVPIASNDDGAVSATTPAVSGGGGGGGGGGGQGLVGITDPSVNITSPNGGEVFNAGDVVSINWSTRSLANVYANIRYSIDGGATYKLIAENVANHDTYTWTVPDEGTIAARIKIELTNLSWIVVSDVSDADFTIRGTPASYVTVLEPNGGEVLYRGEPSTFRYSVSPDVTSIDIDYSSDLGSTWLPYAMKAPAGNGAVQVTLNAPANDRMLWRLSGYKSLSAGAYTLIKRDISDNTFVLRERDLGTPFVRVITPNGGERYIGGSNAPVSYEVRGGVDAVDIALSTDNGVIWQTWAAGLAPSGSYDMTLPDTFSTSSLVRIQGLHAGKVVVTDVSDAVFTIDRLSTQPYFPSEPPVVAPPAPVTAPAPTPGGSGVSSPAPVQPVTVSDGPLSLEVTTPRGALPLPIVSGRVEILRGAGSRVVATLLGLDAQSIDYLFPDRTLTPAKIRAGVYSSDVGVLFSSQLTVKAKTARGDKSVSVLLVPVDFGVVRAAVGSDLTALAGAKVNVYKDGALYAADAFGWNGSSVTGADGAFGGYAENGTYRLVVEKDGYEPVDTSITVTNSIFNPSVVMTKLTDQKPLLAVLDAVDLTPLREAAAPVVAFLTSLRDNPQAVQASETATMAVVVPTAVATAVALGAWFQGLSLLQYMFASPLLLLTSRRRNAFGVVYHSVTKNPVQLATVRLLTLEGKILRSVVTDFQGRFYLRAEPGKYQLQVQKSGFVFPTSFLTGEHVDGKYADLYTGGELHIGARTMVAAINIPIDPVGRAESDAKVIIHLRRRDRFRRGFVQLVAPIGFVASMIVAWITPTTLTKTLLLVQAIGYFGAYLLVHPMMRKGFATVRGAARHRPIKNAFVRLFDTKYNKLVETTVTDERGRYAFLAGPSTYDVTVDHPNYERAEAKNIEVAPSKRPKPVAVNIEMAPKS